MGRDKKKARQIVSVQFLPNDHASLRSRATERRTAGGTANECRGEPQGIAAIRVKTPCFTRPGTSLSVLDPTTVLSNSTRGTRPWASQPPPSTRATRL